MFEVLHTTMFKNAESHLLTFVLLERICEWVNLKTVEDEKLKSKHGMIEVVFVHKTCRSQKIESTTIRLCKLKTFKPTIRIIVFQNLFSGKPLKTIFRTPLRPLS